MPSAGEGLGRPEPQGARIPAPRVHPPHAPKAMSNQQMIPDGLSGNACVSAPRTFIVQGIRLNGTIQPIALQITYNKSGSNSKYYLREIKKSPCSKAHIELFYQFFV